MENETIISKDDLVSAVKKLRDEKARFTTATCVDMGDTVELLYHFQPEGKVAPIKTLRMKVAKGDVIPSVSDIYLAAVVSENEMMGDFNIEFKGVALDFHRKLLLTKESKQFPLHKTPPVPKVKE
jgi:ech hydrogenase subunit D